MVAIHDAVVADVMSEVSADYFPGQRFMEDSESVFAEIQAEMDAADAARWGVSVDFVARLGASAWVR
jgi:hypothetical protein